MEVNDKEMLNVRRIIKTPLVCYPVVQFGTEVATVNCYITLVCDEIRKTSVLPVALWDINPSDCIYMTLTLVKYGNNSLQTFNHYVIMYLNNRTVKTYVMSDVSYVRCSATKIQCMLDKLKMDRANDCDISELMTCEIFNNLQCALGLQFGILVNERVIYLYYKMVDYLYKKCE